MVTGGGYDLRGKLSKLGFYDCELSNPFGSNTVNSTSAWGGGQQTYLSQWIGDAVYKRCLFEGGGEDMTDPLTSPGGRVKDAAIIGGPQRLIFRDNTVRRMGVEAIFNNGRSEWMSQTSDSFVIPPADGTSVSTVLMVNYPTTFIVDQSIVIRIPTTATTAGSNNVFRVIAYDPGTRILSLVNDGYESNASSGTTIPRRADVYLDTETYKQLSVVENNVIEGYFPLGSDDVAYNVGITMMTRANVKNNVIKGYVVGVMSYDDMMPHSWSRGLNVDSNFIVVRDPALTVPFSIIGIRLLGDDQYVRNNVIIAPRSEHFVGIAVYGNGALVENNRVMTQEIIRHDYTSSLRALGLGFGNSSQNTVFKGNYTYGMDVGVGPTTPSQSIPHRVISHNSMNDTLPLDPRGLIEN
jgi:hypothetical protein